MRFSKQSPLTVFWNEFSLRSEVPLPSQTPLTPSEQALKEVTGKTGGTASWPEQGERGSSEEACKPRRDKDMLADAAVAERWCALSR